MKTNYKSKKQIGLALAILNIKIKRFYADMNDHWSESDYKFNRESAQQINFLTKQYELQYGMFPTFENIEEIFAEREALVALLNEMRDKE